jgi:ribonucleotide reductase alpha subunit
LGEALFVIQLTDNARRIFDLRYSLKDKEGNPLETPEQATMRVADNVAVATILYQPMPESFTVDTPEMLEALEFPGRTALRQWKWLNKYESVGPVGLNYLMTAHEELWQEKAEEYYDELLTPLKFVPNSPTWTGAGTPLSQYAACLHGSTQVLTTEGSMSILAVVERHEAGVKTEVLSFGEPEDGASGHRTGRVNLTRDTAFVEGVKRNGVRSVKRLTVLGGQHLDVTVDHRLWASKDGRSFGWHEAGEIKSGWHVIMDTREKPFPESDSIGSSFAALLGWNQTDGYLGFNPERDSSPIVEFESINQDEFDWVQYHLAEAFPEWHHRIIEEAVSNDAIRYRRFRGSGRNMYALLEPHGLMLRKQHKRVPEAVMQGSRNEVIFYLRSVFQADGSVTRAGISLTSASKPFLIQLQDLLLRLGILTRIYTSSEKREGRIPGWRIFLGMRSDMIRFQEEIGFISQEKQSKLDVQNARPGKTRSDVLSVSIQSVEDIGDHEVFDIQTSSGTFWAQHMAVHNCFVLPISDDLGRNRDSIFETMKVAALIQQTGGGNGFDFSDLRPRNALVGKSMGKSSGPVSFLKVYDKAFGAVQQGGCLDPSTLVITDRGILSLDELVDHEGYQDSYGFVWTDEGQRRLLGTFNNGESWTKRVISDVSDFVGTPNHKVKVMTDQGPEWRRLDEITGQDHLVVNLGGYKSLAEVTLDTPDQTHFNQSMPRFPSVVTGEFAWLMGYLAGDGWFSTSNRVGWCVAHDSYLMEELPAIIQRVFPGVNVLSQQKPDDKSIIYYLTNKGVREFLEVNGFSKGTSVDVVIPRKIRESSESIIGSFMSGLFEADGSVSHGFPMLTSTSKVLVDQVASLLLGIGIPVNVSGVSLSPDRYGDSPMWRVKVVSAQGLGTWNKLVPISVQSRLSVCGEWVSDEQREQAYPLPNPAYWVTPVLNAIALPQIDPRGTGVNFRSTNPKLRRALLRYLRGDRGLTLSGYRSLASQFAEFAEHAPPVEGLFFAEVKGVEDSGMRPTLDLVVDDNHTYIANGIVSHNTRRGANMGILRCLAPDTMIHTIEGRFPISALEGSRPYVYACDPMTNQVHIIQADRVFKSDSGRSLVRVWFDNDEYLDCTPDHRLMLKDGSYREAGELRLGDRLKAFSKKIQQSGNPGTDYWSTHVGVTGSGWQAEHRIVARDILGGDIEGMDVHHLDEYPRHNHPDNLEVLSRKDHSRRTPVDLEAHRARIANDRRGRTFAEVYDEEIVAQWRANMSASAKARRGNSSIANHKVVCVETLDGEHDVYDISLPEWHNFAANGVFVHNCDHPDIIEFIDAKLIEGEISNFNISVAMTDEFMSAIFENDGMLLPLEFNGERYALIDPRDLWTRLTEGAWTLGDPGVYFVDAANRENPCPSKYTLAATNPSMPAGTLVATRNGIVPIETLENSIFEVKSLDGSWAKAECFLSGEDEPLLEISLGSNRSLQATPQHHWPVLGRMGGLHRVRTDELRPGDLIPHNRNEGPGVHGDMSLSREDGFFAGYLMGDGWISTRGSGNKAMGFVFADDELALAERISEYMNVGKAGASHPRKRKDDGCWYVQTTSQSFITSVEERLGWLGKSHIPSKIWTSNDECMAGFVDGLVSADGSVALGTSPSVTLVTSSESLGREFSQLISFWGIPSTIFVSRSEGKPRQFPNGKTYEGKTYEHWAVRVGTHSVARFANVFTLSHTGKAMRLVDVLQRVPVRIRNESEYAKVVSITPAGRAPVWDISVDHPQHVFPIPYVFTGNCGEQSLPPYSNCCLGAIAVNRSIKDGIFDWDDFERTIHLGVQFLDDVVDANRYIPEVPELEQAAMNERRIGLGVMGVADALFELGLAYDGDDGLAFIDQMMEFFRYHAMLASIERAAERGPFLWVENSIYDPRLLSEYGEGAYRHEVNGRLWSRPKSVASRFGLDTTTYDFGRPHIDWDVVYEGLCEFGIRNACQTTVAPTGATSNYAGLEGSGIEPAFALSYTRKVMQEEENIDLPYLSHSFSKAIGFDPFGIDEGVATNGGSCQGIHRVPLEVQRVFKVAGDIDPDHHVYMQAVCQAWIDNAISKTINMPFESTVEDVANIYKLAWELGCKGITVYRQGSRNLEVLTTKTNNLKLELVMGQTIEEDAWPVLHPMPMPEYTSSSFQGNPKGLPARVFEVPTPFGNMQVTVTELRSHPGRPFDIRMQIGKAGNDKHADVEAIGRMASIGLRLGVDVADLVDQLEGIGGKTTSGFGPNKIKSVADGLGKLLRSLYIAPGGFEAPETEDYVPVEEYSPVWSPYGTCPECKNASLVMEAGCQHCEERLGGCGVYSACD